MGSLRLEGLAARYRPLFFMHGFLISRPALSFLDSRNDNNSIGIEFQRDRQALWKFFWAGLVAALRETTGNPCQMVGQGVDSILKTSPIFAALLIKEYAT
jgi:hypothetical protein